MPNPSQSTLLTLEQYMRIAAETVEYVIEKMTVGASNKISDVFSSLGGSYICVPAVRNTKVNLPKEGHTPRFITNAAHKAEAVGCGNCGEQAAIAYYHLVHRLSVRPVDYMYRTNADHAFVVLGRRQASSVENVADWGPNAVICDPWHEAAYPAAEVGEKMYRGGWEAISGLRFAPGLVSRAASAQ